MDMDNKTLKLNILLGSMLAGGVVAGCADKQDKEENTNEQTQQETISDPYGNVKLFEDSRSEIKFALAFVENYYEYIYWCGEAWTAGHGLTILYNKDGTSKKVTSSTPVPTIAESDVYTGRYLTFEVLPDIKKYVNVPMDKNTLVAACVLRYCVGGKNFRNSKFVEALNAGKTGADLAKTLTGWRQQPGVLNRCYFFAALIMGKMQYSDLLFLRAEGCYKLEISDMVVLENGNPKCDKDDFYEWDFSKIRQNLEKAKQPKTTTLVLNEGVKKSVKCKNENAGREKFSARRCFTGFPGSQCQFRETGARDTTTASTAGIRFPFLHRRGKSRLQAGGPSLPGRPRQYEAQGRPW